MLEVLLTLCAAGCDARTWRRLEETGEPAESFLSAGRALWSRAGLSDRLISMIEGMVARGWARAEIERCERTGTRLVTMYDATYPKSLLELADAPLVLYMRGDIFSLGPKAIAVVGTRRCSKYAADVAREIGARAAAAGICVVSGGAKGVDAAVHTGVLAAGGRTVAVFGTGIDKVYPSDHAELFDRIRERGATWSESPMGTNGEAWRFPKRNRIVVGAVSRVIVVEAPIKSGAMITARLAGDAGREVWSVPGRIDDLRSGGSNRLILDGAIPFIDMDQFFGEDLAQTLLFDDAPLVEARPQQTLGPTEKILVAILTEGGDRTIDNLASEAKISAAEAFRIMSVLSARGVVAPSGPGRYRISD